MKHSPFRIVFALLGAVAVGGPGLMAQQDPSREIQELARRIDEQMQEIDRLLLESSKPQGGDTAPKELLKRSREESQTVEQTIDELIVKLQEMQQSGGGGQGDSDQPSQGQQGGEQQQPQQGQNQSNGQPQNRRDSGNPEFMQQPDGQPQHEGQQGQDPQQGSQPQGGQENPSDGETMPGMQPPDDGTAPGQPGTDGGEWGNLQPYENFLRNRGSPPKVPEKYRKFWEAYLKARADQKR
ncbi:MAG: hypothetical protein AB7O97_09075 [Planctomycetota bacterium]